VASPGQTDVQDVFATTPEKPTSVDFDVGEPSEVLGISPEADFLSDAAKTVAKADQQPSPEDDFLSDASGTEVLSFESAQAAGGPSADGQRKSEVAEGENTGALPQLDESTLDAVRNKFSLPVTGVKPGKPAPKDEDDSLMEFTLDLPGDDTATQAQPAKPADLAGISLDLDNVPPAKSAALSDEHIQEVATKLDLAKAYQEMGDASGAREILEEVLREGDESQREAANALLAQL
jgi:pilus assembly protein FimV